MLAALRSRRALATVIRLGPLTDDAARAVIRQTADVPEAVVSEIVQCAAGSPLLAVESARAAAEGGLVAGLAGAVRIAVSRLSGPARTFVEFAAVAGRGLDRAEVASLPLPSPALAATEALGSGLLQTDDGRTGFRHALLADAVYQDIADPVRARLHGALAQLLRTRARPARTGQPHGPGGRDRPAPPGPPARTSRPSTTWSWPRKGLAASPRWPKRTAS